MNIRFTLDIRAALLIISSLSVFQLTDSFRPGCDDLRGDWMDLVNLYIKK